MQVTIQSWVLPVVMTLVLLGLMFRPIRGGGGLFDLTPVLRLFWIIPILVTWLCYFGVLLWVR